MYGGKPVIEYSLCRQIIRSIRENEQGRIQTFSGGGAETLIGQKSYAHIGKKKNESQGGGHGARFSPPLESAPENEPGRSDRPKLFFRSLENLYPTFFIYVKTSYSPYSCILNAHEFGAMPRLAHKCKHHMSFVRRMQCQFLYPDAARS